MKGYAEIIWGAFMALALAVGVAVLAVWTHLFGLGIEILGFTVLTLAYYVTCISLSISMIIVSQAARKQAKFLGLLAVSVLLVIGVGFQGVIDNGSHSGGPLDEVKGMLNGLMEVGTKVYMYVIPAVVTIMYALIAFGAAEAEKEAEKLPYPHKE